jgi:hypothetical protein
MRKILFCWWIFLSLASAEITRFPYLQPTEDLESSIGIAWRTRNDTGGSVFYRPVGENNWSSTGVTEKTVSPYTGEIKNYTKLTGLSPGVKYEYYVTSDGTTTEIRFFKTSPREGKFRALILSDIHLSESTSNFQPWIDKLVEVCNSLPEWPALILITGDIGLWSSGASDEEIAATYTAGFPAYKELFSRSILITTTGNHDHGGGYPDQFYYPDEGENHKVYGVFYGGVGFLMIPFYGKDREENFNRAEPFLRSVVDRSNFIFSFHHDAIYGLATPGRSSDYLGYPGGEHRISYGDYVKLFDQFGVSIDFSGHAHVFNRSYSILPNPHYKNDPGLIYTNQKDDYTADLKGTIYLQVPAFHPFRRPTGCRYFHNFIHTNSSSTGYVLMTIEDKVCKVETFFMDDFRNVSKVDEFVIDKTISSPSATPQILQHRVETQGCSAVISCQTDLDTKAWVEFRKSGENNLYLSRALDVNQQFKKKPSNLPLLSKSQFYIPLSIKGNSRR